MDIVFFVPLGLILVFILCILGGIHSLLESLSKILFNICSFIFLLYGIIIIIKGIIKAKNERGFLYGIAETIRGIFVSLSTFIIKYFLEIGKGTSSFKNAEYIFFGNFEILDIYTATLLIAAILILVVSLPVILSKRNPKIICPILTVCLILLSSIGIYKIGIVSEFNNNYDTINWNSPEYKVIQDTAVKQKEFLFSPLNTGKFKTGTELYANGHSRNFGDIEYYLVTDGIKMGYVSSENLQSLVTYTYVVNVDSDLYGIGEQKATAFTSNGQRKEMTVTMPSTDVIAKEKKGTEVTKIGSHAEKLQVIKYLIQLPNGTQGYIDVNNITEIRE